MILALLEAIYMLAALLAVGIFASFLFIFYTCLYFISKVFSKAGKLLATPK